MHKNRVFFDWVRSQYGTDYFYLHIVMPKSNGDMEVSEDYVWPASKFAGRPQDAFWTFIDSLKKGLRVPDPDYSGPPPSESIYVHLHTIATAHMISISIMIGGIDDAQIHACYKRPRDR